MFGFLLSFYTNPWIDAVGYTQAYCSMAGISGGVLIMWIPFFYFGKRIRLEFYHAKFMQWVKWDDDRETGE
jgi:hypothetical protein